MKANKMLSLFVMVAVIIAGINTCIFAADTVEYVATIGEIGYESLPAAISAAEENDTVTVLSDIVLETPLNITKDKILTLDINGFEISGTDTTSKNYGLINNYGTLTIKDSVGTGKISLSATINSGWNRYSAVVANIQANLIVESGTIEHLGGTDMAYAIDNLTNGNLGDATTVIKGGTITSTYRAIRQFANSTSCTNTLTIEGGTISGDNKAVWLQSSNKNANAGTLEITGGDIGDVYISTPEAGDASSINLDINAENVSNVINGVSADYDIVNVDGVWSIIEKIASVTNSNGDVVYYESLAAAISAAEENDTVTMFMDAEFDEIIKIEGKNNITIEGNGYKVTGNATKTFELYNSVNFNNINIINTSIGGRCVDSRVDDVYVSIIGSTLESLGISSQPITVGGYETIADKTAHFTIENSTVTASNSGYAIIVFQPDADINIVNSTLTGYAALYLKPESEGANISVTGTSRLIGNNYNNAASNAFSTIAVEASNVTLNIGSDATVEANNYGDQAQYAINLYCNPNSVVIDGNVVTGGDDSYILTGFVYNENCQVKVADELVEPLIKEGFTMENNVVMSIEILTFTDDSIIVRNLSQIGTGGVLVLSSYSDDGRMTDVKFVDITSDKEIKITDTEIKLSNTLKAALWNDIYTIRPLCIAITK